MNFNRPLILASKSPRRREILSGAGFDYVVKAMAVPEDYPDSLPLASVAAYLAKKKAMAYEGLSGDEILVTADTVVIHQDTLLGKPADAAEARQMLRQLQGDKHLVVTGVCLRSTDKTVVFDDTTEVYFNALTEEEIAYYVDAHNPLDRAGAYGIQDWVGMVGVARIEGNYFTVMGLPIHKVYDELKRF